MRTPLFLALLGSLALSGCLTHHRNHSDAALRDAIESANRRLTDAYNRGDRSAVARMYEDNGLMISSRGERLQGRDAIDKYWAPPPIKPEHLAGERWSLEVLSVDGTEDMPVQRGRSILTSWNGSVSDVQFIVVWRKQPDNSYKIAVDAWWPTPK